MQQSINFQWTAATDLTITKWHLYEVMSDGTRQLLTSALVNTQRSLVVSLDNAVPHTCIVTAENAGGESDPSPSDIVPASITPKPAAPTSLTHTLV